MDATGKRTYPSDVEHTRKKRKADVRSYLDVEAADGDSSEEETGEAYDEELGIENKHTLNRKQFN
ncbi:hypothetical protein AX14_014095 [Amanita brunnescens Koide BX004]|nr:hypothetical protein AX14_014095 [Amanita brunnescens Koide BX004]